MSIKQEIEAVKRQIEKLQEELKILESCAEEETMAQLAGIVSA